jgi:DNA-binding NtrC family response regulator
VAEKNLLIIDDEAAIGNLVRAAAAKAGFAATSVTCPDAFWTHYNSGPLSAIVMDLNMPEVDGVELLRELVKRDTQAGIILMSGCDQRTLRSVQRLARDHRLNVIGILPKPFTVDQVQQLLGKLPSEIT